MKKIIEQIVRLTIDGDETKTEVVGELVRCKDCKWHDDDFCLNLDVMGFYANDYCSLGPRKETEDGKSK